MSEKSVVIVGAGMAGLSAGCYARMNGYKATTLEMHNIPGGLCTAWKRKGYTFDISMHMLTGSKGGAFHRRGNQGQSPIRASILADDVKVQHDRGPVTR